jgi:hypothetical protein
MARVSSMSFICCLCRGAALEGWKSFCDGLMGTSSQLIIRLQCPAPQDALETSTNPIARDQIAGTVIQNMYVLDKIQTFFNHRILSFNQYSS